MTKIYKICGKEIKGFTGSVIQTPMGVGTEMPTLESRFNQLLEALDGVNFEKKEETFEQRTARKLDNDILDGISEHMAKLDRIAERDAKGSVVETPRPTYKEELESCTKCELDARGHYMKELKHDCGKEEPKSEENEFTQILRDAKDWDSKEDPKSTLRENGTRIVYEYLRSSGITFNTIDSREIADKIISLFKDTLIKELPLLKVERWTTTGAPFVSEENIAHNNVIKNIKDIIKNL